MWLFHSWIRPAAGLALLAVSGCAYTGDSDPASRKFSWFDYLGGGDIRAACAPGVPDRYRFVYNAIYVEQVRTYDLTTDPATGDGTLRARVIGPARLSAFSIGSTADLTAPWRGATATASLDADAMATLESSVADSGVFDPAPAGLRLDSDKFYWTVVSCRDGVFHFNAFQWPSDRFDALRFPEKLFAGDATGVEVHPPRQADALQIHGSNDAEGAIRFVVEVAENGLKGTRPLF